MAQDHHDDDVQLTWPGKFGPDGSRRRPAVTASSDLDIRTVEQYRDGAPSWRGSLYHGGLHDVLPRLDREAIDFAYLDPPFRVGKRFRVTQRAGDDAPVAYDDRDTPAAYCAFMDDAIQLVLPRLKQTGIIAIHTDYRTAPWIRLLLDEHLGADACINELIWHYGLGNARNQRSFLKKHDTIAVYSRSPSYYFSMIRGEVTAAQNAKYCHEDEHGRYMLSYGRKYYLKGGKPLDSVLEIPALSATDRTRTGYPTQKPTALLGLLMDAFCPPGGCVLDPVCGSGTTAIAAIERGCSWTLVDRSALAIQHATRRVIESAHATKAGIHADVLTLSPRAGMGDGAQGPIEAHRVNGTLRMVTSETDPIESWTIVEPHASEPTVSRCWFRPRPARGTRRRRSSGEAGTPEADVRSSQEGSDEVVIDLAKTDASEYTFGSVDARRGLQETVRVRTRSGGLYELPLCEPREDPED